MEDEVKQATFSGWAVIEMMGHRKESGFVVTEAFGPAVLFRVDTPELPAEREFVLESPEYANFEGERKWCPAGTKVKRAGSPARSCLVAPSALYAINPCTEEFAMKVIERSVARPLIVLELPEQSALPPAPNYEGDNSLRDDDEDEDHWIRRACSMLSTRCSNLRTRHVRHRRFPAL